jgi:hypothetical protein
VFSQKSKEDCQLKKSGLILIGTILALLLGGCRQEETFDDILHVYDRIADNEAKIAETQRQKHNLKERGNELSSLIITRGVESNLTVLPYIEEKIESIHNRQNLIEEQIQIMDESREELEMLTLRIETIENEEAKRMFLRVQAVHMERYEVFMELSYSYLETIRKEIQFYNLLQEEEQNLEELENMTVELNQIAITESELQDELARVSIRLNEAINALARGLGQL